MEREHPLPELRTAEDMLDTCAALIAAVSAQAARDGAHRADPLGHAEFVARCVMRVGQTRAMHRDFLAVATGDARRLLGQEEGLDGDELLAGLRIAERMHERALAVCAGVR